MVDIVSMRRIAGAQGGLGAYYFSVRSGDKTVDLKFQTFPTSDEIDSAATAAFETIEVPDTTLEQKKALLVEIFGDLDGDTPEGLAEALARYRALVGG